MHACMHACLPYCGMQVCMPCDSAGAMDHPGHLLLLARPTSCKAPTSTQPCSQEEHAHGVSVAPVPDPVLPVRGVPQGQRLLSQLGSAAEPAGGGAASSLDRLLQELQTPTLESLQEHRWRLPLNPITLNPKNAEIPGCNVLLILILCVVVPATSKSGTLSSAMCCRRSGDLSFSKNYCLDVVPGWPTA